jgi:hypothetical protein
LSQSVTNKRQNFLGGRPLNFKEGFCGANIQNQESVKSPVMPPRQ